MELRAPTRVGEASPVFYQTLLSHSRPAKVVTDWIKLPFLNVVSRTAPVFVIPIHEDTRQKLDEVETFVKTHYSLPADLNRERHYKPLSRQSPMHVMMKEYCCCLVYDTSDDFDLMPIRYFPVQQAGWYRFTIYVSAVCITPHQEEYYASIIPQVGVIEFKKE